MTGLAKPKASRSTPEEYDAMVPTHFEVTLPPQTLGPAWMERHVLEVIRMLLIARRLG
ncbi:hypothetical protein [Dyella flagellata]|uniref:hypothetical protein n=1 Tax=Dyella flagellata TaxID=1867833 RepID=UPI0024E07565|nr:hypothetical protein [Dyella flagellata]